MCFIFTEKTPSSYWNRAQTYWMAKFLIETSFDNPHDVVQEIQEGSHKRTVRSVDVLHDPRIAREALWVETHIQRGLWKGVWIFWITFGLVALFFFIRGYMQSRKIKERGQSFSAPQRLTWRLKLAKRASDLNLDGVPLLKDKETQHILITGTTGSGKTNCFNTLLPQIRHRPNQAIVVDLTGDLVKRYYRPHQDLLLNPLDARSEAWSPWADCHQESHFDTLAQAIIPPFPYGDPFWRQAGKELLSAALRKMKTKQNVQELYHILVTASLKEFSEYFYGYGSRRLYPSPWGKNDSFYPSHLGQSDTELQAFSTYVMLFPAAILLFFFS